MGRRQQTRGRNFLKNAERGLTNSAPCGIIKLQKGKGDTMNKEYTVTYRTVNGFLDSEEFDDLLKMWEFVIRLKEDSMVTKIWVDTSQVVFERED